MDNQFLRRSYALFCSILIFSALCTDSIAQTQSQKGIKLSLTDALDVAFEKGPSIVIDSIKIAKVKEDKKALISKFFPQVDMTGSYGYTIKKQVMYFGGSSDRPKIPGMPDMSKGFKVGRTNNVTGGITVGMPIVAPQLWTSIQMTKQQLQVAVLEDKLSKASLTQNVTKAYYALQLAIETAKVLKQSYENAERNFQEISQKYDAGLVAWYDKVRAKVQVKNMEPNLLQSQHAIHDAQRMLNILMGVPIDQPTIPMPLDLDDNSERFEQEVNAEALRLLYPQSRPFLELEKTDMQIAMMKTKERMAIDAFMPSLSIGGFLRVNAMDDSFKLRDYQWTPFSALELTLKIPIFSGGERLSGYRKARLETEELMIQRQQQRKTLDAELQKLHEQLRVTLQKITSANEAITLATKGYEIAKSRYDTGASTLVELNDADLALLQAKLNLRQAAYDFYVVKADIEKLNGVMYTPHQESVE